MGRLKNVAYIANTGYGFECTLPNYADCGILNLDRSIVTFIPDIHSINKEREKKVAKKEKETLLLRLLSVTSILSQRMLPSVTFIYEATGYFKSFD